jgi:hypothetical protein
LIAGNIASKDAALNAAEVGVTAAYNRIKNLSSATASVDDSTWYSSTYSKENDTAAGLPSGINWSGTTLNSTRVGVFNVSYYVERFCSVSAVTDINNQCSIKVGYAGSGSSANSEALQSTPGTQYRITVNVTGPKELSTFVQAVVIN